MNTLGESTHLSEMSLDLLLLGELPDADSAREHLRGCPECDARYASLSDDAARFDRAVFPRTRTAVTRAVASESGPRTRFTGFLLAAAAAVGVVTLLLRTRPEPLPDTPRPGTAAPEILTKGGPAFTVHAKTASGVRALADGERLREGDSLRFSADPGGYGYLIVGSVDGSLRANVYYPFEGSASARLEPGRRFEDTSSVVLDGAPGPERLFAVFSATPIASEKLVAELRRIAAGGAASIRGTRMLGIPDCHQASILLEK